MKILELYYAVKYKLIDSVFIKYVEHNSGFDDLGEKLKKVKGYPVSKEDFEKMLKKYSGFFAYISPNCIYTK